jgi:hypothetical protein
MEILELDRTNTFVLQKHHLAKDPRTDDLLQIIKDIRGLHATLSTTPYLSLFLRSKNFKREDLDEMLYTERLLGKVRYARKTVYVLPKEFLTTAYSAFKSLLLPRFEVYIQYLGHTQEEYEEITQEILHIVKGSGKTTKEIKAELKRECNASAIVNLMCDQNLLIRGKPRSGWKSNLHTYYPFNEYFPDLDLNEMEELNAKEQIVRHYLSSYGPVTVTDISWWTGFLRGEVKRILEVLKSELISVEIAGISGQYVMLSSDNESLNSVEVPKKPQVHLLPALDPYLMGFKDRQRLLDDAHSDWIYDRSGNATYVILVNGRIAGVWDWIDQKEPELRFFLFGKAESSITEILNSKAKQMGHFVFDKETKIKKCDSMTPLSHKTMGGFMSPLKNE